MGIHWKTLTIMHADAKVKTKTIRYIRRRLNWATGKIPSNREISVASSGFAVIIRQDCRLDGRQ